MTPIEPAPSPIQPRTVWDLVAPYKRAVLFALFGLVQAVANFGTDDRLTAAEITHSVITALGLILVYMLPDAPFAPYVKTGIAVLIAGLEAVVAAMDVGADFGTQTWFSVLLAVGAVLGTIPKNEPEPAVPSTSDTRALPLAA